MSCHFCVPVYSYTCVGDFLNTPIYFYRMCQLGIPFIFLYLKSFSVHFLVLWLSFISIIANIQATFLHGAWITQWLEHSLAIAATQDRIPMSACGRVVVARPRSVVFTGFSGFLHQVGPQNANIHAFENESISS